MFKIKRLLGNEYIYSVVTKLITILIGIVQSVLTARYLGAQLKGVNTYISSIASIGSIVITFGMHQAYPYYRKKYGKDAIYQDFVSLIMLIYTILMVAAISLCIFIPTTLELKAVILLIPMLGYSRIVAYITLVETPNLRNTWWTVISILDVIYVALLWAFTSRNILLGISVLVFADAVKCIVYTSILRVKPKFSKKLFTLLIDLLKYGFFPMIALLMTTLNYRIDVLMLKRYNFITDSMIGVYSLGLSLSDKIVLIPDTLKGVLVSKLAKGAKNEEVAKVCRIGFWTSVLLCVLIIASGKLLISILYGEEFEGAYSIIIITAWGLLSVVYFKLIAQFNIVNKKQFLNVLLLSIAIVVDVVLNLLFIPILGIVGAAIATSIGNIVCGIVFVIYFCKKTGIPVHHMIVLQKSDFKYLKAIFGKKKVAKNTDKKIDADVGGNINEIVCKVSEKDTDE